MIFERIIQPFLRGMGLLRAPVHASGALDRLRLKLEAEESEVSKTETQRYTIMRAAERAKQEWVEALNRTHELKRTIG